MRCKAIVFITLLLAGCDEETPPTADLVIRGGSLIDGTGSAPRANTTIIVHDGVIQEVSTDTGVKGRNEIDAEGKWILPGFVDIHMHFQEAGGLYTRPDMYDLTEHYPFERERKEIVQNVQSTLARHLCAGVTTAVEVGGPSWSYEVREMARTIEKAPNVFVAGPFIGFGEMQELWTEKDPSIAAVYSPEEATSTVLRVLERQPDLIKIGYVSGDLDSFGAVAGAAAETAHQAGLRLYAHTMGLESARQAILGGADTLVHSVYFGDIDDDFLRLARESNIIYAATAKLFDGYYEVLTNQRKLLPIEAKCGDPRSIKSWGELPSIESRPPISQFILGAPEMRAQALKNLARVHKAGIRIATGSDAGNIGTLHGASLHREFQAMAEAGMQPMEIIVSATRNGAHTLAEEPDFGTIEPGKRADILILGANPLDDIANAQAIDTVIRGGVMFSQEELIE